MKHRIGIRRNALLNVAVGCWLGLAATTANAQPRVYDQTSNPKGGLYLDPSTGSEFGAEDLKIFLNQTPYSVALMGDVGQTFTVGEAYLNVFELYTLAANPLPTTVETFVAHLRLGGPDGQLLATSEAVTFGPNRAQGDLNLTEFRFPTTLSLSIGESYYCDFERTHYEDTLGSATRSVQAVKQSSTEDLYKGGELHLNGTPVSDPYLRDLWFRTGYTIPEPETWALLALGLGALGWRWRAGRAD